MNKGLTTGAAAQIIIHMPPRTESKAMSDLLRKALSEAESIRSVAIATGLDPAALGRFLSGRQSLRLDLADKLAAHFGIESTQRREKEK